jgi:phosphoenolpyruvate carboxykinase (GTP)
VIPLVSQSRDWNHGVFLGSIMSSETTAAATGAVGNLRRDPFAMLPFCGYNMADYFAHWLTFSERFDESKLPKIFYVNWFRKGEDGRWLWPGYGENSARARVGLRAHRRRGEAVETVDRLRAHDRRPQRRGTQRHDADMAELLRVDKDEWRAEIPRIKEHYAQFNERLPKALDDFVADLEVRLA